MADKYSGAGKGFFNPIFFFFGLIEVSLPLEKEEQSFCVVCLDSSDGYMKLHTLVHVNLVKSG